MSEILIKLQSPWFLLGLLSQFLFFARFVVQWIASEKRKESYIPRQFWYFSLFGGLGLLVYSIHIKDPVFVLGCSLNLFIYIRNIILIKRKDERC